MRRGGTALFAAFIAFAVCCVAAASAARPGGSAENAADRLTGAQIARLVASPSKPARRMIVVFRDQHADLAPRGGFSSARSVRVATDQAPVLSELLQVRAANVHAYSLLERGVGHGLLGRGRAPGARPVGAGSCARLRPQVGGSPGAPFTPGFARPALPCDCGGRPLGAARCLPGQTVGAAARTGGPPAHQHCVQRSVRAAGPDGSRREWGARDRHGREGRVHRRRAGPERPGLHSCRRDPRVRRLPRLQRRQSGRADRRCRSVR